MPSGANLPITPGMWLAASLPILVLLLLLVWRRWSTATAAPVALVAAVATAMLLFRTPLHTLAVATGKGIWDAIFVLYVVWPALILYNVADEAGAFQAMQQGVRRLMPDRLLVVLAYAWVLTPFLQGIAGFGTPLAVTAPLLVGLGVRPGYAVVLPIIGGAWANAFGSLGAGWLATQAVVDIPDPVALLRYAGTLLFVPDLTAGVAIAWIYGRGWGLRRAAPAIVVITLLHSGLQLLLLPIVPTIATFLATGAALVATLVLNRWGFYRRIDEDEPQLIFTPQAVEAFYRENEEQRAARRRGEGSVRPAGQQAGEGGKRQLPLWLAFAPYAALAVLAVLALLVPPVNDALERFSVGLPFPATATGYGVANEATPAYSAFTPLTHPGTLLLLSAAVGYVLFRARHLYGPEDSVGSIVSEAAEDALPATTAITALLVISKVMDHSGEVTVLGLGIAAVAPSAVYVAAAGVIGAVGSFITSSNTASNVLFAPLQATAAQAEGVPLELAIAAQMTGGAVGNAIAPGDALLGAAVVGIPQRLGTILARAIPWTVLTLALLSLVALALYLGS